MNKEEELIYLRAKLKVIKQKYENELITINKYISRIDTDTCKVKEKNSYDNEKEYNKDLLNEIKIYIGGDSNE